MSVRIAPTRRMTAASLGKMPTTRARTDLLVDSLEGVGAPDLGPVGSGKAVNANTSDFAVSMRAPIFGNRPASWSRTSSQVAATAFGSGWAKMLWNTAAYQEPPTTSRP